MHDDASPTTRALLALAAIQGRPGITAAQLAERLGVSDRAARRYVAILREADLPIESTRGPYGGYRVGRGLHLPPLLFSATEALGLVMAVLDGHHDAGDSTGPVGSALAKIIAALPSSIAEPAETMRRGAAAAPDRSAARPDPETTASLVRACAQRRRVRVGYRSEAGSEWEREVDPWAVVVRHGRWYLLCRIHPEGARRAYRVDRVASVEVLDAEVVPPADLDPVAVLEEHLAQGWRFPVELLVTTTGPSPAPRLPAMLGRVEQVDETTWRVVGSTSNPSSYAVLVASVPLPVRVALGEEVRTAVQELAKRLGAAAGPQS
ncbi:MAG: WYL domain-containing protein [Nocardioides sp.]